MTTRAQLRKAALALPDAEERAEDGGTTAFEVHGNGFAWLTRDGTVRLAMSDGDAARAVERIAAAQRVADGGEPAGIRVPIADVNGMELNALVEKAWAGRAPSPLAAARRAANRGEAPAGPDALPTAIGRPATRALLGAGIDSLKGVADRTEAQLLALHGVGPKAIRILGEALAERDLAFRRDEGPAGDARGTLVP